MTSAHPGLRHHIRVRKSGKVVTYYYFDRRGLPSISLGSDYSRAVERWAEIYHQTEAVVGTIEEGFRAWESEALPGYKSPETKRGYTKGLRHLRKGFAVATWDAVTLQDLRGYLKARAGKTQANREISLFSLIWNWCRIEGYTDLPWPAAGLAGARWKNKEQARKFRPTEELYSLIFAQADQVLKDCMTLSSVTAMRLTDCREVLLPKGDLLRLEASKTGKEAAFDISLSKVLPELIARRRAIKADHLMLLSTPGGKKVTPTMLRDRWDLAREKAAELADPETAKLLRAMWLRDMRKLASRRAGGGKASSELLQHGDQRITDRHYPGGVVVLRPVG